MSILSGEPHFEPWRSSTFHIVKTTAPCEARDVPRTEDAVDKDAKSGFLPSICREENPSRRPSARHSQTRLDQVDVKPLHGNRYYSSIATQTDNELEGFPSIPSNERGLMTRADRAVSPRGALTARPEYGMPGGHVPYNNFYQRIAGGAARSPDEPQTARPASQDQGRTVSVNGKNRLSADQGPPIFRSGSHGAPWRHVRQCLGNLGNHICFVDGAVKQHDISYYPPYGYTLPTEAHTYISPRLATATDRNHGNRDRGDGNKYTSSYNVRAKKGFKYWNDDRKPVGGGAPKQTIQGRMMKLGVGF